ncbi:MAG: rhomboid family intramembrane serine protease [Porphyromonadaceae bacterium]|nr:rhomboid family intramembrane serine protease [Porphyromonadaceae bacterium]
MASLLWSRRWGFVEWFTVCVVLIFVYSLTPWADGPGECSLQRWVFRPTSYVWLTRPWTALTYALIHVDLLHLVFNLVALAYFYTLAIPLGRWRLMLLIALATISGAFFYTLGAAALSAWGAYYEAYALVGSSSAVFGLCTLNVLLWPGHVVSERRWGRLRLWHLAMGLLLISLLGRGNIGGLLAHVGGVFAGCVCYWLWDDGKRSRRREQDEGECQRLIEQARRSGTHSLSREEREWLKTQKRSPRGSK